MESEFVIDYFSILKKYNLVSTSYIFIGNDLEGIYTYVIKIIKLLFCRREDYYCDLCQDCYRVEKNVHPNIMVVTGETSIKIEQIREAQRFLYMSGFSNDLRKCLIVKDGGILTLDAANAFLRTLEEPPNNSFIAILTTRLDTIIPTIRSRCKKLYLPYKEAVSLREGIVNLINGFFSHEDIGDKLKKDRKTFQSFLETLITIIRDYFIYRYTNTDKYLINRGNYEIIKKLNLPLTDISGILDRLFYLYYISDTTNVNLAYHIIKYLVG